MVAPDPTPDPQTPPDETPQSAPEPEAKPIEGQTLLFAPEDYKVTKVTAVLGGITIENDKLAECVLNDEIHLNIRDARVVAVQYRQDGEKRITLYADSFRPTIQK